MRDYDVDDLRRLCGGPTLEGESCRLVREQVSDSDGGPFCHAVWLDLTDFAIEYFDSPPGLSNKPAGECQMRDCSNTSKCLAAESKRPYRLQVSRDIQLAGGVTSHRERQLLCRNPMPIVNYGDEVETTSLNLDVDARRTCVDRVLQEFLDYLGGPLNDLSCGNQADGLVIELLDWRPANSLDDFHPHSSIHSCWPRRIPRSS